MIINITDQQGNATPYFLSTGEFDAQGTRDFCLEYQATPIVLDHAHKFQEVTSLLVDYSTTVSKFYVGAELVQGR